MQRGVVGLSPALCPPIRVAGTWTPAISHEEGCCGSARWTLRYGVNLFLIIEFGPPTIDSWTKPQQDDARALLLSLEGIGVSRWWLNIAVLGAISVVFRLIGIVTLSRRASKSA